MSLDIGALRLLRDKVLVQVDTEMRPEDRKTAAGLYVGGIKIEDEKLQRGIVLKTGPGKLVRYNKRDVLQPTGVEPGQRVCWHRAFGRELEQEKSTDPVLLILDAHHVHGILEEET